jgi:hypothetical protein
MFTTAASPAVDAISEALPAVVSLSLGLSAPRLVRQRALAVHANIRVPFRDVVLATDLNPASDNAVEAVVLLLTTGSVMRR